MDCLPGLIGAWAGAVLVALLAVNIRSRSLRIWPAPAPPCWQSGVFWSLFRTLNLTALALAALDWTPAIVEDPLRFGAALLSLGGGAAYVLACIHLGRTNLYGGKAGLVTTGIYAWTRNPQYALAMPTYVALAAAVQSLALTILAVLLVAVFVLMAINEEPWLEASYGEAYRRYRARVPRFYDVRRLQSAIRQIGRRRPSTR